MRRWLALGLFWVATIGAAPTMLITDLSQNRIDINTTFHGAELLVFGAIQYPRGQVPDAPPDIAVVVRGPQTPVTVRKKGRVAGIWVNTDSLRFETVPAFYAVAATQPLRQLADERTLAIYELGVGNLQLSPSSAAASATEAAFESGLIALKRRAGLFAETTRGVAVSHGVLYSARIGIPAAVPVGDYDAEVYLIRKGRVVASTTVPIAIGKSGFERWVYVVAHEYSLLYGLAAVGLALLFGWSASLLIRR